jgi:hypothetical protein
MNMKYDCRLSLARAGFSDRDANSLRRIAMTLHRWFELECGDSNSYGSWAIVRREDDRPFIERHIWARGAGKDEVTYTRIPDREAGARRRLADIMAKYPAFEAYIQTDPRGASLYIVPKTTIGDGDIAQIYPRGIAVCE